MCSFRPLCSGRMLSALPDTDQTFRRGRAAMLLPGEGEGMNAFTAWAVMWVAVSAAVIAGIYLTGSVWCLWALVIPSLCSVKHSSDKEKE